MSLPIAITIGEPAGIGYDILAMAAQKKFDAALVAIGCAKTLSARAKQLNLPLNLEVLPQDISQTVFKPGRLYLYDIACPASVIAGQLNAANNTAVFKSLDFAAKQCLSHKFAAVLTGPVHKAILNQTQTFRGQTEYFAKLCHTSKVVMMLASSKLKVALVTTHVPLAEVSQLITKDRLTETIQILHQDLQKRFKMANPRILVCGLNPHAGEDGYLGKQEIEIINPVIEMFQKQAWQISKALPADTLFTPAYLENCDAVLSMYHDQGLPVLKSHAFGNIVNISLGLPILRTSVDHGTALDKAGTGLANANSLLNAIEFTQNLIS